MKLFARRRRADGRLPTYSNESVIETIERDAGVDRATARTWFNEMLIFLDLAAESKDFISPPKPVDAAWHAFILHTREYEAYCRERFGRVIHHEPTGGPDPGAYRRAYDRRRSRGSLDPAVWAVPAVAAESGDAGGGSEWGGGGGDAGGGNACGGGGA
jgi:hypothetical protein